MLSSLLFNTFKNERKEQMISLALASRVAVNKRGVAEEEVQRAPHVGVAEAARRVAKILNKTQLNRGTAAISLLYLS